MLLFALVLAAAPAPATSAPLGLDDCVRLALEGSSKLDEAEAKVHQWEARLAEVESLYYPKLTGLGFLAPMYTVEGDILQYQRHWKSLGDWGPYAHLQATLAQPLYSFGRATAARTAAEARVAVERARAHEVQATVVLEVKKLYFGRLYALSMIPALTNAKETATSAIAYAERAYEEGTGEVTQTDLAKLRYADSEVDRYLLIASDGVALAEAALKHTMGVADDQPLVFDGTTLPALPGVPELELAPLLREASEKRPEWTELGFGRRAALALEEAEKLANAPVMFLGGSLTVDWSPTRQTTHNPFWYDPYNQIIGGIALGFLFNLDPALASAKAEGARAVGEEVDALARFAKTGIPLQVRKAHAEVARSRELVTISERGVAATKKWLAFASAAYSTGTGDARELLEGLVSFLQARRGYYDALYAYHLARAELDHAVGR